MNDSNYASTEEGDVLLIFESVPIDGIQTDQEDSNPEAVSIVAKAENVQSEPSNLEMPASSEESKSPLEDMDSDRLMLCEWNIDNYRNSFETDEHWELRRKFMVHHKRSIPEEELVALAQAFSNYVILNAVYCEELSARLNLLGASIAEEYRKYRGQCITKITLPASDAIADWQRQVPAGHKILQQKQLATQLLKPVIPITSLEDVFHNFILMDDNLDDSGREFGMLNSGLFVVRLISLERKLWEASITAAGYLLNKTTGQRKQANRLCREKALELLRRKCYKIKTNPNRCCDSCNVERLESTEALDCHGNPFKKSFQSQTSKDKLKEDNIGFRMLKKLGWGGGPLGKHKDGIVDPIEVQAKRGRKGLGLVQLKPNCSYLNNGTCYTNNVLTDGFDLQNEAFNIDVNFYRDLMVNFRTRRLGYDLIFSIEFTEIERALLCKIASDVNLQCKTVTYDYEHYQFILLKHHVSPHDLLVKILVEKHPIYSALYTVEPPVEDLDRHKKVLELCSR